MKGNIFFKEMFLAELGLVKGESMLKSFHLLFTKIAKTEEKLGKDLYQFNKSELLDLLHSFETKTYNSAMVKSSLVRKYIERAEDFYGITSEFHSITTDEVIGTVVQESYDGRYVTRKELEDLMGHLENPVDKSIFLLLFEGVMGKAYEDLLNLKVKNVDTSRKLLYINSRVVPISDFTNKILYRTINTDVYYKYVADLGTTNDSYKYNMGSQYVIKTKPTIFTEDGLAPLKIAGLKRRLDVLTKLMNKPLLSGKTIFMSGVAERIIIEEEKRKEHFSVNKMKEFVTDILGIPNIQSNDIYKLVQHMRDKVIAERGE